MRRRLMLAITYLFESYSAVQGPQEPLEAIQHLNEGVAQVIYDCDTGASLNETHASMASCMVLGSVSGTQV
jgi:hypothetical protein